MIPGDRVAVDVDRLSDRELRGLLWIYEGMAADDHWPEPIRNWYADLAHSIGFVLGTRLLTWHDLVGDIVTELRMPRNWAACVAMLPPEPTDGRQ